MAIDLNNEVSRLYQQEREVQVVAVGKQTLDLAEQSNPDVAVPQDNLAVL